MKRIKISRRLLIYVYVILLVICIGLNITDGKFELSNIAISAGMFVIVGIVFGYAYNKLGIVAKATKELRDASKNINDNYLGKKQFLWDYYKKNPNESILQVGYLAEPYKNFCDEMQRLEGTNDIGYRCEIEDYISQAILEDLLKKNILSLVPGTMTGLGILGTFIGLTIGLQHFSTGTTDDIINSIPTLMDGIKIAFHTSIFGMVFSLFFNFVYKAILEDALVALDDFLDDFRGKVSPDSQSENEKLIIDVGNKQSETILSAESKLEKELVTYLKAINETLGDVKRTQEKQMEFLEHVLNKIPEAVAVNVATEIATGITTGLEPQFNQFGKALEDFASQLTEKQNNSLGTMVSKFMQALNKAVGDNFTHLATIIEDTCDMQEESNKYMQEIIHKTGDMSTDIQRVNEMSQKTLEGFSSYIELLEKLQAIINDNFVNVNIQLDANSQIAEKLMGYVDNLTEYERRISESTSSFAEDMSEQVEILERVSGEISGSSQDNLRILAEKAEEYNATLADAAKQQINGIQIICQQIAEECSSGLVALSNSATANSGVLTEEAKKQIESVKAVCQGISDECAKSMQAMAQNAEANNTAITESARQQIQQIVQLSTNVNNELDRASSALAKTAVQLNGNLEASLGNVLQQFDGELANVSTSISDTVSQIDETTKQVPSVVAGAYDAMYKVFDDMRQEMTGMRNEMQTMTNGLKPVIDSINALQEELTRRETGN